MKQLEEILLQGYESKDLDYKGPGDYWGRSQHLNFKCCWGRLLGNY